MTTNKPQMALLSRHRGGEHVQQGLPGPHGYGFRQHFEFPLGGVFQDDKDAAVPSNVVKSLILEGGPRYFGQPQRPVIIEDDMAFEFDIFDRKVFSHV